MSIYSTNLFSLALISFCFVTFTILFTPLFALVDGAKHALCFSDIQPVFAPFFGRYFFALYLGSVLVLGHGSALEMSHLVRWKYWSGCL